MKEKSGSTAVAEAECIGRKNNKYLAAIIFFIILWAALIAICIIFYKNSAGLFLLLIAVCAVLIVLCAWEAINFLLTPAECVKRSSDSIYFWSARKWHKLELAEIDEVRTNGMVMSPYTTMRSIIDRGGLRIFDRRNNLYRVKYLTDPEEIKAKIDEMLHQNDVRAQKNGQIQ